MILLGPNNENEKDEEVENEDDGFKLPNVNRGRADVFALLYFLSSSSFCFLFSFSYINLLSLDFLIHICIHLYICPNLLLSFCLFIFYHSCHLHLKFNVTKCRSYTLLPSFLYPYIIHLNFSSFSLFLFFSNCLIHFFSLSLFLTFFFHFFSFFPLFLHAILF